MPTKDVGFRGGTRGDVVRAAGLEFLTGGGDMGALIRAHDWAASPLGPVQRWPQSLRAVVGLMLSSKFPMYLAWGPELTFLYNDGFVPILGSMHPGTLGQRLGALGFNLWDDIKSIVEHALAGQATFGQELQLPMQRRGFPEQAYFTHSTSPIRDETGRVNGVFCVCLETTPEVTARQASAAERERLRALFQQAPSFMAISRGPDHLIEMANAAYMQLVGTRALVGKRAREALPELQGQGFFEAMDRVYATGEALTGTETAITLQRTPGGPAEERFVNYVYQPIRDATGEITGIFVEGSDVTQARHADEGRREADRFARATIDALAEHIAVIDATGQILMVNQAWRAFAAANGAQPDAVSEGANYLEVCASAAGIGTKDAATVATLIGEVAIGTSASSAWQYPCHGPNEARWYCVNITRFAGDGPVRVVVAHENITERRTSAQKIAYLATHDVLTGLPNRILLGERAAQAIEHCRRTGQGLALLFLDLDNFKYLNDAHGHAVGDAILAEVARELRHTARAGDTIARLGGDEFVVFLTELQDAPTEASRVARAILERFSRPLLIDGHEIIVASGIGISLFPADGETLADLLKNADTAMSVAKSIGRSRFQFYAPGMSAKANERLAIEAELRRALQRDQFELHYQPKVLTGSGEIVGMEALLRWSHPDLGLVPPTRFIPVAEERGMIVPIGQWVLKTACAQNKAWQDAGLPAVPVAVNISSPELRQPNFAASVAQVLATTGLESRYLELEITESMLMSRSESTITALHELKTLGVSLAIDDFGTGYSNLSYLRGFPLDRLKIDRSFISDLPQPQACSIVRAIVSMGHSLGLEVIAEGVETAAQAQFLDSIGCLQAQGFYFSTPLPAEGMALLLKAQG